MLCYFNLFSAELSQAEILDFVIAFLVHAVFVHRVFLEMLLFYIVFLSHSLPALLEFPHCFKLIKTLFDLFPTEFLHPLQAEILCIK